METSPQIKEKSRPGPRGAPGQPLRIFVKGLNWVGDAIMATPALSQLRHAYPKAKITMMVRPWVAAVYEHSPDIDVLWVHDDAASPVAFLKAVRLVRTGHFQLGLALPNSFRAAALLWLGQVRYRIGYRRSQRGWLLSDAVAVRPEYLKEHQIYYYLHLIEGRCGKLAQRPRQVLRSGELEREEVRRLLAQRGLDRGLPLVGIAPGSINSSAKRWPTERFAALADRIAEEGKAEILLLGSGKELDVLERVAAACKAPVHNLGGAIDLGQLIALIERLAGLVCNDSGAMHMGAAIGIPTVALFGPTEYETTYPFSRTARIVRKAVTCAPCMLRECPTDHHCMLEIGIDEAFEGFKSVIKESRKTGVLTTTIEFSTKTR